MAKIYRNLIANNKKNIDQVPNDGTLREDVLKLLAEIGLDGYGQPLI